MPTTVFSATAFDDETTVDVSACATAERSVSFEQTRCDCADGDGDDEYHRRDERECREDAESSDGVPVVEC